MSNLSQGDQPEKGNSYRIELAMQDWSNASITYQNLTEVYLLLGELNQAAQTAQQALALARRSEEKQLERNALAYKAWVAYLRNETDVADALPRM
jgi:hypothetical protein